jgi:vacuolar-type H+-ATPase subunit H
MPKPAASSPDPDEAIQRILQAEHRAREHIAQCEREAAQLLEEARGRARRLAERTDARISKLRMRCEQLAAQRVAALREEAQGIALAPVEAEVDEARLRAAVERLAARLTGGTP